MATSVTPDIALERSITSPEIPGDEYPAWSLGDEDKEPVDSVTALNEMMSYESVDKKLRERNERGKLAMDAFLSKLRDHGMDWLADPVYIGAMKEIAIREPSTFNDLVVLIESAEDWKLSQIVNFGLCAAIALSNTEPERAAALLARCENLYPPVRVLIGKAEIPFDRLALWSCASNPSINDICYNRLCQAGNDRAMAEEVLCAERAGKRDTVLECINNWIDGNHPAEIARALTLAGFCDSDNRIDELFQNKQFEYGFLADVATQARAAYSRNKWARHWLNLARSMDDPTEYWRYSELMVKSSDARFILWFPGQNANMSKVFSLFHLFLIPRLRDRAKTRAKKRNGTLFGLRPPSNHLLKAVGLRIN